MKRTPKSSLIKYLKTWTGSEKLMITLKDIYSAMCGHISDLSDIPLVDADLDEPIVRPSFKVFMDTVRTGFYSSSLRRLKVYFTIYFYSEERAHSKAEVMEIEDKIAFSFMKPFHIKDTCAVYIDDLEFERVEDGILCCSFNFEISTEFMDETDIEMMEKLYLNNHEEV